MDIIPTHIKQHFDFLTPNVIQIIDFHQFGCTVKKLLRITSG